MPDLDAYIDSSYTGAVAIASQAGDAWRCIQDVPADIVLVRSGVALNSQTVRIEISNTHRQVEGESTVQSGRQEAVIFGVRGHPDVEDTDIRANDRFAHNGIQYRVIAIVTQPGEVQARCEALS
jgi:hypothetical protein